MEAKFIKTIIDNNDKEYKIGDDVIFELLRNDKCYKCYGVITDITEKEFTITSAEIDDMCLSEKLTIRYKEVKDGIFHVPSYS